MKKISFEAEDNDELISMIFSFLRNQDMTSLTEKAKKDKLKKEHAKFLQLHPIGSKVKSMTRRYKYFPAGELFEVANVDIDNDGIKIQLIGKNEKSYWLDPQYFQLKNYKL